MTSLANANVTIIKKKRAHKSDGHHGGAWKVAYADFVTAMMAFFMLMWLLSATTEKQRNGIADYFSPTIAISKVSGGGDGMFGGESVLSEDVLTQVGHGATNENPADAHQSRGATGLKDDGAEDLELLRVVEEALIGLGGESMVVENALEHIVTRVTDEGLVIELFATDDRPLFEGDTATATPLLRELARIVSEASALVTNDIALGGHLSARPIVLADNPIWELSAARAHTMRNLLQTLGMSADRFHRVTGHADRSPITDIPMQVRNNRIEVILLRNVEV